MQGVATARRCSRYSTGLPIIGHDNRKKAKCDSLQEPIESIVFEIQSTTGGEVLPSLWSCCYILGSSYHGSVTTEPFGGAYAESTGSSQCADVPESINAGRNQICKCSKATAEPASVEGRFDGKPSSAADAAPSSDNLHWTHGGRRPRAGRGARSDRFQPISA